MIMTMLTIKSQDKYKQSTVITLIPVRNMVSQVCGSASSRSTACTTLPEPHPAMPISAHSLHSKEMSSLSTTTRTQSPGIEILRCRAHPASVPTVGTERHKRELRPRPLGQTTRTWAEASFSIQPYPIWSISTINALLRNRSARRTRWGRMWRAHHILAKSIVIVLS